jgi:hypothetical protein
MGKEFYTCAKFGYAGISKFPKAAVMKQFPVAVIIEKTLLDNRWISEKWEAIGVVPAFEAAVDAPMQRIFADDRREQFLFGRFDLKLFRDEVDNYHLNLTSPEPRVFVMWRMDEAVARPASITLSYGEAARHLDSGEQCDGVPMPPEIADWLGDFVNTHYKPAVRKKVKRNDPFRDQEAESAPAKVQP